MKHEPIPGAHLGPLWHWAAAAVGLLVIAALLYELFAVAGAHMEAAAQTSRNAQWHTSLPAAAAAAVGASGHTLAAAATP